MPPSLRKDCLFNIIVGTYKSYVIKDNTMRNYGIICEAMTPPNP